MRGRQSRLLHLSGLACVVAACGPTSAVYDVEPGPRDDLWVQHATARVSGGLTDDLVFAVPEDVTSLLFEVSGGEGLYGIAKLETPDGVDQAEAGQLITRDAREVPGVVSWMWPNRPWVKPAAGPYTLVVRGETVGGGRADGVTLDLRLVMRRRASERCGIRLDFLVASDAVEPAAVDDVAGRVAGLLAGAGVELVDYTVTTTPAVGARPPSDGVAAVLAADDRLWLRHGAIPVVVQRVAAPSTLRGYALGLPGPYSNRLANAAVVVYAEQHVSGAYLDPARLAVTTTHELGHYLGLYHTSELSGALHDPLDDTPMCGSPLCTDEFARNIMSPGSSESERWFSAGQGAVVRSHPMCAPLL